MNHKIRHRIESWVASWLDIICALINIVTFTVYRPWWDYNFRVWTLRKQVKRRKEIQWKKSLPKPNCC